MVVVLVCVCGGDEAISKLKGAGATHALPRSYLHVSILLCPHKSFVQHIGEAAQK